MSQRNRLPLQKNTRKWLHKFPVLTLIPYVLEWLPLWCLPSFAYPTTGRFSNPDAPCRHVDGHMHRWPMTLSSAMNFVNFFFVTPKWAQQELSFVTKKKGWKNFLHPKRGLVIIFGLLYHSFSRSDPTLQEAFPTHIATDGCLPQAASLKSVLIHHGAK